MGLLMGKLNLFLLSAPNTSVFYFQDNNFSKSQWFFNFDVCICTRVLQKVLSLIGFLNFIPGIF